ncbi:hypothetical protein BDR26DRAFT_894726 [Obelidium mucronatum]|nr:hypothetical protein BDR26DRAFT_894726 [Obelidium mucronatum]
MAPDQLEVVASVCGPQLVSRIADAVRASCQSSPKPKRDSGADGSAQTALIAGVACGVVVLAAVGALFAWLRLARRTPQRSDDGHPAPQRRADAASPVVSPPLSPLSSGVPRTRQLLSIAQKPSVSSFATSMGSFSPPKRNLTQKASMESGLYSQFSKATSFRSRANSLVSNQPSHIRNLRADLSVSVNSDPVNNVSIDGLRFTYVLALIEEWGGRAALEGKTTSQVGQDHIIGHPSANTSNKFPDLSLNVREANWFVSHVWEYKFLDVIDTLERFFMAKQIPLHEAVIWIDLFSISQNESDTEHKFEWWNNAILSAFKRIKNVVLVLENWFDPVPLKRSWCTYEIFCSTMARSNFNIALSESNETALINSLYSDPSILYKSLSTFKSEAIESNRNSATSK